MKASLFQIQIEEDRSLPPGLDLLLPERVYNALRLDPTLPLTVNLGLRKEEGRVGKADESQRLIRMRKSFADRLPLPFSMTLYAWFTPDRRELTIGPTFGILLSGKKEGNDAPFGIYNAFCNSICDLSRQKHLLCYVVPLRDIHLEKRTVTGWIKEKEKWTSFNLPLPGVLYNRLSFRSEERTPRFYSLQKEMADHGGILFNDRYLSKWEVAELLQEEKELHPYLPQSVPAVKLSFIQEMLTHSSTLFLKPYHGSEGRGIIRVRKTADGYYTDEMKKDRVETHLYPSLLPLLHTLRKKIKQKKYLLQKGIPLLSLDGRIVDFRALLQKGKTGHWKVISFVARIGRPELFVSNVSQGGSVESGSRVVKQLTALYPQLPPLRKLKSVAQETAKRLENRLSGHYGEFGIDLGLSAAGEIWIIEVNAKPSKKEETGTSHGIKHRPSVQHLLNTIFYYTRIPL